MDISWPCYCAVLLSKYTKDIVLQHSLPETINPEPVRGYKKQLKDFLRGPGEENLKNFLNTYVL